MSAARITIGHLLYSFGKGGMEHVLANVINSLDPSVFRHVVVVSHKDLALESVLTRKDVRFVVLQSRGVLGKAWELLAVVRREGITVLHARGWSLMLEGGVVGLLARLPSVYSFHGKTFSEVSSYSRKRLLVEMVAARMYRRLVTLTPAMRDDLCSMLRLKRAVQTIANGAPQVELCEGIRSRVRSELGIGASEFVLGFAGRFDRVKDLKTLVLSFDRFLKTGHPARLVLVGDGEGRQEIENLAEKLGIRHSIVLTGFSSQVQNIMQGFDVYLQTSLYEGLSNTIIEALSVGLPVICTDVGGNGDIIVDGVNGFLISPGDVAGCSARLEELIGDAKKRERMRRNNLNRHRQEYSLERMIASYADLYSTLS